MATQEGFAGLKRKHDQELSVAPTVQSIQHIPPPTKKPRTRKLGAVQTSRKAGKLSGILDVPPEIRLEIFSQGLSPLDLLNVSKTNWEMWTLLNGSTSLWQSTMDSCDVPAPPCPEGHNIVQWAAFLFGEHCQLCQSRVKTYLYKSIFMRLCWRCVDVNFVRSPYSQTASEKMTSQEIGLDDPEFLCNMDCRQSGMSTFRPQLAKLNKEIEDLGDDEEKRKKFLAEALVRRDERYRVAKTVAKWLTALEGRKKQAAQETRQKREQQIVAKLEAEGYIISRDILSRLSRIPRGVRVSKPLTDGQWLKIRPAFIQYLEDMRRSSLNKLYPVLKHRFDLLRLHLDLISAKKVRSKEALIPPISSVAKSPEVLFLRDTYPGIKITGEEVSSFLDKSLEAVSAEWKTGADKQLRALLPAYVTESTEGLSREEEDGTEDDDLVLLERATTWFVCLWCTSQADTIDYPRILHHSCLRADQRAKSSVSDLGNGEEFCGDEEDLEKDRDGLGEVELKMVAPGREMPTANSVWAALISSSGSEWSQYGTEVIFDDDSFRFATAIIKACGEDPLTVTHAQMNKADYRLECTRDQCVGLGQQLVMDRYGALVHTTEHHSEDANVGGWKLYDDTESHAKAINGTTAKHLSGEIREVMFDLGPDANIKARMLQIRL